MKKKLIAFIMVILALGLVGCGNGIVKKSIEQAKASIEIKEYDKALLSLEMALDEDNDNEEANKLYSIVDKYQKAKKLLEENNADKAKNLLDEMDSEYVNYKIKDDIDSLKQQVEDKIKEIELVNSNLNDLLSLIDEKKYDEANALFEEINKSSLNEEQTTKLNALKTRIDTELAEIEAQKKAEEEANKKKQYEGTKDKYIEKLNALDAELAYAKDSYEKGTTADLVSGEGTAFSRWDGMLNEIYNLLKIQLSASEMEELTNKQISWIEYRDKTAENESATFGMGSLATVQYNSTLARVTKERCYELVNTYMK
ncbi:lysozyme inhibitor LprI family protein [Clostridium nigeriense]|uniref:lysozyme inhibitor LprI family protein n=1 Tax=Clostridium nigeriense TaxID=1805470 RepID=UPI003D342238